MKHFVLVFNGFVILFSVKVVSGWVLTPCFSARVNP